MPQLPQTRDWKFSLGRRVSVIESKEVDVENAILEQQGWFHDVKN
jgi:hypothetical protein